MGGVANTRLQKELEINLAEDYSVEDKRVPKQVTKPVTGTDEITNEIPEDYDIDHRFWKLNSDAPIKATKQIGKAIKKGMMYVVYKHKETGDLKEIELGLTVKQIRLRLSGTKQAGKRKAERLEEAVKKGQKKLSHAMKGIEALEDDHEEMQESLDQATTLQSQL